MAKTYICKADLFPQKEIPTNDIQSRDLYPKAFHLHNRYWLQQKLGYKCGDNFNDICYPVYVKEKVNLYGMGGRGKICYSYDEVKQSNLDNNDFFWCKYFSGTHLSIDYVILKGFVIQSHSFIGHKDSDGNFDYWEYVHNNDIINPVIINELLYYYSDFTGIINVETIAGNIIECHLRMGDIYHLNGMRGQIINLYLNHTWNPVYTEKCYLFAVFKDAKDLLEYQIKPETKDILTHNVEYYQFRKKYLDHTTVRVFFYKVFDLDRGKKVKKHLVKYICQ